MFVEKKLEEKLGVSPQTFIETYKQINRQFWDDYSKGLVDKIQLRDGRFRKALEAFGWKDEATVKYFSEHYIRLSPEKTHLFPGASEVLSYLHESYPLYIITNGFEEVQHRKLRNSAIDGFFREVITSEKAGVKKPDPAIFQYALSLSGVSATEAIMIGDEPQTDLLGAKNLGIDQVYFDPHDESASGFTPTYRIRRLEELRELL